MNKEWKIRILVFIISGIIFTGVGIYAETKINADKITYKDTTVDDALNSLYLEANKDLNIIVSNNNLGGTGGLAALFISEFKDSYKTFKITKITCGDNGTATYYFYSKDWSSQSTADIDILYNTEDYACLDLKSNGKYSCTASITFYK